MGKNKNVAIWYQNHSQKKRVYIMLESYLRHNQKDKVYRIVNGMNDTFIEFKNGNRIEFVPLKMHSRGKRFTDCYIIDTCTFTLDEIDEMHAILAIVWLESV